MLKRQGFYTLGKLILYGFSFCNSVVVLTDESTLENSLNLYNYFLTLLKFLPCPPLLTKAVIFLG